MGGASYWIFLALTNAAPLRLDFKNEAELEREAFAPSPSALMFSPASAFDFPWSIRLALGMLVAGEQMESDQLDKYLVVGELALDGAVRSVKGVLPIALRAREEGRLGVIVPVDNASEAAVVSGLNVIPVRNLREAASFLEGQLDIAPTRVDLSSIFDQPCDDDIDFAEVKGQESVKRALEIAAAGGPFYPPVLSWDVVAKFCIIP